MTTRKHVRYMVYTIAIGACVLMGYLGYSFRTQQVAMRYFASALHDAQITQSVSINGMQYEVVDGNVISTTPLSFFEQRRVLEVAYKLALAQRAPILNAAGVDPDILSTAVERLSDTQVSIARLQNTPRDRLLVQSLYPLEFLKDLVALRKARQAFLLSGTDTDALLYDIALDRTLKKETADLSSFRNAYVEKIGERDFRFPTLGGTISKSNTLNTLDSIQSRLDELKAQLSAREKCTGGDIRFCDTAALLLTPPRESPDMMPDKVDKAVRNSVGLGRSGNMTLALSDSACLSSLQTPYIFIYGDPTGIARMPLRYSGDTFFAPTQTSGGTTMQYLHDTLGMHYSLVNPIESYICPDSLADIGRAYALVATIRFAREQTDYAQAQRDILLSKTVYQEDDALRYVRSVTDEILSARLPETSATLYELEELLQMWRTPIAGLDMLISTIADVNSRDIELLKEGVPVDISAHNLFMTHSAFASLFITASSQKDFSPLPLRIMDAADIEALSSHMIPYSVLVKTVPKKILDHDMSAFLSFEDLAAPNPIISTPGN